MSLLIPMNGKRDLLHGVFLSSTLQIRAPGSTGAQLLKHTMRSNRQQMYYWRNITMRTILLAMLVAAAIGLAGTSGVSAVPVNGAVIGDLAKATGSVAQVQGGHWRWGSRGGRRY
jgi:hypothetical protein